MLEGGRRDSILSTAKLFFLSMKLTLQKLKASLTYTTFISFSALGLTPPSKMSYMGMSQHIDFDSLPDPNTRFELLEIIGEGTYGEVYAAKDHETGTLFYFKTIKSLF